MLGLGGPKKCPRRKLEYAYAIHTACTATANIENGEFYGDDPHFAVFENLFLHHLASCPPIFNNMLLVVSEAPRAPIGQHFLFTKMRYFEVRERGMIERQSWLDLTYDYG